MKLLAQGVVDPGRLMMELKVGPLRLKAVLESPSVRQWRAGFVAAQEILARPVAGTTTSGLVKQERDRFVGEVVALLGTHLGSVQMITEIRKVLHDCKVGGVRRQELRDEFAHKGCRLKVLEVFLDDAKESLQYQDDKADRSGEKVPYSWELFRARIISSGLRLDECDQGGLVDRTPVFDEDESMPRGDD